jgi:serine/threonine-protein kinase RsbT
VIAEETRVMELSTDAHIVRLRQFVREQAVAEGFSLVDQTKFVTAASELARNTLIYGKGGEARLTLLQNGNRRGLRLTFVDHGPGIADINRALQDGFTSGGGLGLGLGGARRLCDEFEIRSDPGVETAISITKWKPF